MIKATICIVLMVVIGLHVPAQELRGTVTGKNEKPVPGAHLALYRDGVLRNRTAANGKGKYHIWPIEPGGYQAIVSVAGYDRIVRFIDIKTRGTDTIDFALHKTTGILSK